MYPKSSADATLPLKYAHLHVNQASLIVAPWSLVPETSATAVGLLTGMHVLTALQMVTSGIGLGYASLPELPVPEWVMLQNTQQAMQIGEPPAADGGPCHDPPRACLHHGRHVSHLRMHDPPRRIWRGTLHLLTSRHMSLASSRQAQRARSWAQLMAAADKRCLQGSAKPALYLTPETPLQQSHTKCAVSPCVYL